MSSRLHEKAEQGFAADAARYERGRPGYPGEAVRFLAERLGLLRAIEPASSPCSAPPEETRVVDLGAGTGKFTRCLLSAGVPAPWLVAVEPVEEMRRELERLVPGVRALEGTAESIPLESSSVDAVVAAQAFHWFRPEEALREIHRVLRPGGLLGLIWNAREIEGSDFMRRLEQLIDREDPGAPRYRDGRWRSGWAPGAFGSEAFTPLEHRAFGHVHVVDEDAFVARVASISYVAALPGSERTRVERELGALFREHAETRGRPSFAMPYRTDVWWSAKKR